MRICKQQWFCRLWRLENCDTAFDQIYKILGLRYHSKIMRTYRKSMWIAGALRMIFESEATELKLKMYSSEISMMMMQLHVPHSYIMLHRSLVH